MNISVIVPVYNSEKYLNKCIDSILEQTLVDIEIILVDDGSTDSSGKLCDQYSQKDKRIKVIHKENEGVSKARNKGIEIARGKYIMFADSDDYVEREWCKVLYELIEKNKNELVICGFSVIDNRGKNSMRSEKSLDKLNLITKITKSKVYELSKEQLLNPLWNKIYVRDILIKNNIKFIENLSLGEDLLFNLKYLRYLNKNIKVYNYSLYNYELRNQQSLDNKYYENLFQIYKQINQELYRFMLDNETNMSEYEMDYYTSYIFMIHKVFKNTFSKNNNMTFIKKIKYNSQIMKSNEFNECLNKVNPIIYKPLYLKILSKKKYLLVYLFEKFIELKRLVKNN